MDDHRLGTLRIPLYCLFYLKNGGEKPFTDEELKSFRRGYDESEFKRIVDGLRWAATQPEYPFASLLPELPASDQEAYEYLVHLLQQIDDAGI